jgi:pimeloyl-ACP methyl ester carboxylesterase
MVEAYSIQALAGDVLEVMGDAGVERADVVGHDWALPWPGRLPR